MKQQDFVAEYLSARDRISEKDHAEFEHAFASRWKNPVVVFFFSLQLGFVGMDRFVLGHPGLGLLKLITFGGLLVWMFADWFRIAGLARDENMKLIRELELNFANASATQEAGT